MYHFNYVVTQPSTGTELLPHLEVECHFILFSSASSEEKLKVYTVTHLIIYLFLLQMSSLVGTCIPKHQNFAKKNPTCFSNDHLLFLLEISKH